MLQSWLGLKLFRFLTAQLNAGNPRWILRFDHPDVQLAFPGDNSWSGRFRGKQAIRLWLERFARVGLQIVADEVIVQGWPWRMTACVRGRDHLDSPEGERIYDNRYVIWGELRWGRLFRYEVYEDTQKAKALDEWLNEREDRLVHA